MTQNENIGRVFGIYAIVDVCSERHKDGHLMYKCQCAVCKQYVVHRLSDIKQYNGQCQHLRCNWGNERIGRIFNQMVQRCYNSKRKDYQWYGAKGVNICEEWLNNPNIFEQWALNNGYSDTLTIDRINSELNYCPDNCRWIPLPENTRRAGNVNWITINNETLTGRQWSGKLGLGLLTIDKYVRTYGTDITTQLIEAMLKEPPSTKHRRSHQTWLSVYGIQV
jgi:hypothetical protein